MRRKSVLSLILLGALALMAATMVRPPVAQAAPDIFASPIQAGCYLTRPDRCKIHVDPFTINIAAGQKLVQFQLVAIRTGTGKQTVIYDFRPDQSNPVPFIGTTFTPSLVAKDFAATCGQSYTISLQGRDSGDASLFNLGSSTQFTCPTGTYRDLFPLLRK
jgi:hypothetical protein